MEDKVKVRCNTFTIPCAYVPLFKGEVVLDYLHSLESIYNAKITLTDKYASPIEVAHGIAACDPVFTTQQICSILIPIFPSDDSGRPPLWFCYEVNNLGQHFHEFSATDSAHLENMMLYGGTNEEGFSVNFKEMSLQLESGKYLYLYRFPKAVEMRPHQISVNIHALSLLSNVEAMHEDILLFLRSFLIKTEPIYWSCPPKYSAIIQNQLENFVKQFCVSYDFIINDQVKAMSLEGAPGYVEYIYEHVKSRVSALETRFSSFSVPVLPMSFHPPHFWTSQNENCTFCCVSRESDEWNVVRNLTKESMPNVLIESVERVQNLFLWERYCLEAKHMVVRNCGEINERYLFHGTSRADPKEVARDNFGIDFRFSKLNRPALMWGTGAYYADNLKYSNNYAYKDSGGSRKVILVSVLLGKTCSYATCKQPDLTRPPIYSSPTGLREYDTVSGVTHNTMVYVVYDHCKAYPAYIITYHV